MKKILENKNTENENENENGRSMIEMLGVLAIIGVLSVGGIAGYSKAMHRYRLNKTIEQITLIAGNVRAFFAPQKNYAGISDSTTLRKAKIVPEEMWDETAKKYINVYGYTVDLDVKGKAEPNDKLAFQIGYGIGHTAESIETCIDLFTHDWSSVGMNAMLISGPGPSANFKTPVAIDVAVNKCESVLKSYQNTLAKYPSVYFYFDIDINSDYWKNKTYDN